MGVLFLHWLDVSPQDGRIAVPLENGEIKINAPPVETTWEAVLGRPEESQMAISAYQRSAT